MYSLSSKISYRGKLVLNHVNDSWNSYISVKGSRRKAVQNWKMIRSKNETRIVDQKLKRQIKQYCRKVFDNPSFWPWLAVYTELRGEFIEGWIPEDYYRFTLLSSLNPEKFRKFSEPKTMNHKLFKDLIVQPLFFRSNGQFCDKDGIVQKKADIQQLLKNMNDEIIIKPDVGRGGKNIMFKHSSELSLDELPVNVDLLFQNVVHQHPELNRLYPHSINTFRVLTYIDQQGSIKVKFITIRFGKGGSRVDNATSGGGWLFVQKDKQVNPVAYDEYGIEIGTRHPDTSTEYATLDLPFLSKIITLCKNAHQSFPYTRIVGWDVFIDREEKPKLIEWNAEYPALWPIEARFGPFFEGEL